MYDLNKVLDVLKQNIYYVSKIAINLKWTEVNNLKDIHKKKIDEISNIIKNNNIYTDTPKLLVLEYKDDTIRIYNEKQIH